MAARCFLCGKEFSRSVSADHLKSHGVSQRAYAGETRGLTKGAIEFYWTHKKVRSRFPTAASFKAYATSKHIVAKYPQIAK